MLPERFQVHPNKNELLGKVLRISLHLSESINFKFVRYLSDIRSEICRRLIIQFWRFKQIQGKSTTCRNKGNWKKYFFGCYITWLKAGIYAVTNVAVCPNLMYIQCRSKFLFLRKQFFLEGIQAIQFNHKKPNKQSKTGILNNLTKDLVIIASSIWPRY